MPKGLRPPLMDAAESDYTTRARSISSVSRTMGDLDRKSQQAANTLSSDVSSLSRRQKSIEDRLRDVESYSPAEKDMKSTSSSILKNVNLAMITLAAGMKKITMTTAGALKDAVGDYGRAISEDFSINKQNLTAMALSRISPVFGYFVSKFMQTDVYRRAIEKIKDSMSSALSAIGTKVKGWFHMGGKSPDETIDRLTKKMPKRPKKMQAGGYVSRGGLAQVHAAEVIMPIDKVMDRMGSGTEVQQQMLTALEDLNIHMRTFSDSYRKDIMHRKGLVGDFIRSLISGEYGRSWEMQMLFLQKEIRNAIVDQSKNASQRMEEAMEVTMRRHPTFRAVVRWTRWTEKFGKFLMWTAPIKTPYKIIRWGLGKTDRYQASLNKALSGKGVFNRIEALLSLIYTGAIPPLDTMARIFSKASYGEEKISTEPGYRRIPKAVSSLLRPFKTFGKAFATRFRAKLGAITGGGTKLLPPPSDQEPQQQAVSLLYQGQVIEAEYHVVEKKYQKKSLGLLESINSAMEGTKKGLKKWLGDIGTYLLLSFSVIKDMFKSTLDKLMGMIKLIPGFGMAKGAVGLAGRGIGAAGKGLWGLAKGGAGLLLKGTTGGMGLLARMLPAFGPALMSAAPTIAVAAAGAIGYGIGWLINKGIDYLFGEKGGLGSWIYDFFHEKSFTDRVWDVVKAVGETLVSIITWPMRKMGELAMAGIGWIWEKIKKIPGMSTVISWGEKAFGKSKDIASLAASEAGAAWNSGKIVADIAGGKISSLAESFGEDAMRKWRESENFREKAKTTADALYAQAKKATTEEQRRNYIDQAERAKKMYLEKANASYEEFMTQNKDKFTEMKKQGIDVSDMVKKEVNRKIEENQAMIDAASSKLADINDSVKQGAKNVVGSVNNSTSTIVNNTNVNNNNMGPSESRFSSFGSGDRHASLVLQCNPAG